MLVLPQVVVGPPDAIERHSLPISVANVLLDSGQGTSTSHNADILGIDLARIDKIVLSHGHFDHTGSCAYLREKYGAEIAMHQGDLEMVEGGDMFFRIL